MIRTVFTSIALAGLAFGLFAACGDDDDDATATATQETATTAPSQQTTPEQTATKPPATTAPSATATSGSGGAATSTSPSVSNACKSANLKLEVIAQGAAAGTHFENLILTNTGTSNCTISGYPGLSLLDANGQQIGEPADRQGDAGAPVVLAPGDAAHAMAGFPNWQNFNPDVCPVESVSLKLFPPEETVEMTVPFKDHACPGWGVRVFEAGRGERAGG
jgi:hypothetical protein